MTEVIGKRIFNYLIGFQMKEFNRHKLPTYRDVINLFMYKHLTLKLTIHNSTIEAIDELEAMWNKIGIPTTLKRNSIRKFEKFYNEYKNIKKQNFVNNNSDNQKHKEESFVNQLNKFFDIADNREVKNLSSDLQLFLEECRQNDGNKCLPLIAKLNIGSIISSEQSVSQDEQNDVQDDDNNIEINLSQKLSQFSMSNEGSSQSSNHSQKRPLSDYEDEFPEAKRKRKVDVMTEILVAVLDRTKTSNRSAMHIISAVITSLELDIDNYNISYTTIRNARLHFRKTVAGNLKDGTHESAQNLIVHWDGKLLPELSNQPMKKVERLPIVVSGMNVEQLLGVPALDESTGANESEVIFEALNEWNLSDSVVGMCFDTTSVNTACRHHIFEIILKNVAAVAWPSTNSPNVPIFVRFKSHWQKIDKLKYDIGTEDVIIKDILNEKKTILLPFIADHLQNQTSRDDYYELLKLSYIFLGEVPNGGIKFRAPGAMHHARWLSKALYSLKIYMFRKQFHINPSELRALREVCLFIVLFYVEAWFVATSAIEAPYYDLKLFQNLLEYKKHHPIVAEAALEKLSKHLWYLNENLTGLALFDKKISREEKLKIVDSIRNKKSNNAKNSRFTLDKENFEMMSSKSMSDFVSRKSLTIFDKFNLTCEFLDIDPDFWEMDEEYITCCETFEKLRVVNDTAERCVALIEKFNEFGTYDEDQKQYLLLIVQQCRKEFPTCSKKLYSALKS